MTQSKLNFSAQGDFIQGSFRRPNDVSGEWISRSPGDFSDELGKFQYSYFHIETAVQGAREAFLGWRRKSLTERSELLRKYQASLKNRQNELAEVIAREVGKPLWEARTEVIAMINKIDITLTESLRFVADFTIPQIMENTQGVCRHRPLGVLAVIGPFNFPGHLPNGHLVPALLTGNTVIFKPSEKAPMVAQVMAECFQQAGFPPGVFNLLQGEREVGRRLCVHEGIDGILFTGSYEVGTRIKQDTLQQHWKLLALEMGGKNSSLVWEDADLDWAVHEVLLGGFLTAGQRCSATSRVVVSTKIAEEFIQKLHQRAKAFSIGHPMENPFMGPLIDQGSVDRYLKFLGIASREGCELVMRGKVLEFATQGNYVAPSICWAQGLTVEQAKKSIYQQTELFAPSLCVVDVNDLDEAIAQANITQYGLVSSVFSRSRSVYEKCLDGLEMGIVNWNKSTVGASSRLPFGGIKKSGNHFPTAVSATRYCTFPVASLEVSEVQPLTSIAAKTPGLNWS